MEVARTSMIHAAAPHLLWPFAVRYTAHQLNLWPRVSFPETSPTLRWTGKVGDASVFRVWGSRAIVRDTTANKLSARAIPCVFLGFSLDAPGWQFYHPTSRHVFPSQDVMFDESVPFYHPLPGTASVEVAVGSGAVQGAAYRGAASGGAESGVAEFEDAGSGGAEPGGEEPGSAEPAGVEPGGAEPEGVEPGGAGSEGAEFEGAEPRGAASSGGLADASPRLSPQQLREWLVRRARLWSGATGVGAAGARGAGVIAGAGGAGAGGGVAGGAGVGGTGVGGAGAGGAGVVDPGGTVRPRPYLSQLPLQPTSPLPAPSPYTEQSGGLLERREPASRRASPVCTTRRVPRSRPPLVPGTHTKTLCPSSVPPRVPLPAPLESSLPEVLDPESSCARAASPTVSRLLDTVVSDPSFESAAASALVAELLDFAAACRLNYATALVAES
ncbi:unnamed protein product [Closterium sp. NIES-53]